MKIYMDVCCLCRPFDDDRQARVRMEAEAVKIILSKIKVGEWSGVKSSITDYEISMNPDMEKKIEVMLLANGMDFNIVLSEADRERGRELQRLGYKGIDAMHIACAERAGADVFLTTDDNILKLVNRHGQVNLAVENPLRWLERILIK